MKTFATLALTALSLTSGLSAQPQLVVPLGPPTRPRGNAANGSTGDFGGPQIQGVELRRAVDRVVEELTWYTDLAQAARVARKEQRPIFWIQALGDLTGYT